MKIQYKNDEKWIILLKNDTGLAKTNWFLTGGGGPQEREQQFSPIFTIFFM